MRKMATRRSKMSVTAEQTSPSENKSKLKNINELVKCNKHICSNCGKSFAKLYRLKRHEKIHTNERAFKCEECGKCFIQKEYIRLHQLTHTKELSEKCQICEHSFAGKQSLKIHMRIHTGEWPYKCEICGARQRQKSDLQKHMQSHTDERPFSCNICKKSFKRSSNFREHMRIHLNTKPYECEHCGQSFTQNSNLSTHVKKVHREWGKNRRPWAIKLASKRKSVGKSKKMSDGGHQKQKTTTSVSKIRNDRVEDSLLMKYSLSRFIPYSFEKLWKQNNFVITAKSAQNSESDDCVPIVIPVNSKQAIDMCSPDSNKKEIEKMPQRNEKSIPVSKDLNLYARKENEKMRKRKKTVCVNVQVKRKCSWKARADKVDTIKMKKSRSKKRSTSVTGRKANKNKKPAEELMTCARHVPYTRKATSPSEVNIRSNEADSCISKQKKSSRKPGDQQSRLNTKIPSCNSIVVCKNKDNQDNAHLADDVEVMRQMLHYKNETNNLFTIDRSAKSEHQNLENIIAISNIPQSDTPCSYSVDSTQSVFVDKTGSDSSVALTDSQSLRDSVSCETLVVHVYINNNSNPHSEGDDGVLGLVDQNPTVFGLGQTVNESFTLSSSNLSTGMDISVTEHTAQTQPTNIVNHSCPQSSMNHSGSVKQETDNDNLLKVATNMPGVEEQKQLESKFSGSFGGGPGSLTKLLHEKQAKTEFCSSPPKKRFKMNYFRNKTT